MFSVYEYIDKCLDIKKNPEKTTHSQQDIKCTQEVFVGSPRHIPQGNGETFSDVGNFIIMVPRGINGTQWHVKWHIKEQMAHIYSNEVY